MLRVLAILVVVSMCGVAVAEEFLDTFSYPDGGFPPNWTWTGDTRGGGSFSVQNEELTHTEGGHVHYFRNPDITGIETREFGGRDACRDFSGIGLYEFDVKDTYWEFAWRIDPADPAVGRCLVFYHNDYWGSWAYTLTEFSWSTLSGYPGGQYMWHNGSDLNIHHSDTGPLVGWHHVVIDDQGGHVDIQVDGELVFSEDFQPIPDGYVGLGAATGSGAMTPAYDNVEFRHSASPTSEESWGCIKALYQ